VTEKKEDKKKVWIYAVILFTSAFIVLLLTAVSQIKLNKNISDYKTQIFVKEKEKSDFKLNLSSSMNENKKLQEELKTAKSAIDDEIAAKEAEIKKQNEIQARMNKVVDNYEKLLKAENEFVEKEYLSSALTVYKQIDSKYLNDEATKRYLALRETTFEKAAKILYTNGLKKFKNKSYGEAVGDFQLSVELMPYEYYSDDCYYYSAYSSYKIQRYDAAAAAINKLIQNYPASSYISDCYDLLKLMRK
jgi:TolA-binding protein